MPYQDHAALLDLLAVGVVVHAPDGRVVYASAPALALLGTTAAELEARTVVAGWDVRALDGHTVPIDALPGRRALVTGQRQDAGPLDVARPDGTRLWLNMTATPLVDGSGVVLVLVDVGAEQARHAAAQGAFERSELRKAAVLRAMREGLIRLDADGVVQFCNEAAARLLGQPREALLGRVVTGIPWRLRARDGAPLAVEATPPWTTLRTGRAADDVIGVERADGAQVWLRVSSAAIAGDGDPTHGLVVTLTDVTAERAAQLAQAEALARQAAIDAAVPGVIFQFRIDADGVRSLPYVGGQLAPILGLRGTSEAIDPAAVRAVVVPEDLPGLLAALARSHARLSLVDQLVRIRRDGGVRCLRLRAAPARVGGDTLWTGVAVDVTEEQALAEAVRRAQRRDAMGDLAAGIAHNFNNMLAVILPNLEAARELAPAATALLHDATLAAARATELVKQLLLLARGASPEVGGTCDLVAVVHDAANLCRRTFDRAIAIEVEIAPGLSAAITRGNAGHLVQAVINLCINARDALAGRLRPRIALVLEASAEPLGDADDHYALSVHDNGCGMSHEVAARLGEPFFTTKEPGRGTGLGLATVYGTLRTMGGAIDVTSAPGVGTTFVLRCPAVAPEEPARDASATGAGHAARRVLLVEDEELVRRIARRQLERGGHVVVEARSGLEALAALDRGATIDVILLDLSMPGLSGIETLEALRARGVTAPVIVVSGDASPRPGLERATVVLQKPVAARDLLDAIAAVTA